MIELIFVLIIIELVVGLGLIVKIHKTSLYVEKINSALVQSGFNGNLTGFRLFLVNLNQKLQTILQETEKKESQEAAIKIINSILFLIPAIDLFFKKIKKHK